MFNIGSEEPAEQYGNDEFFDTDEDTSFTRAQLEGVLQRAGESQQANQQAISQAHPQQVEREQQQQGEGILRTLGRGNNENRTKYRRWSGLRSRSNNICRWWIS